VSQKSQFAIPSGTARERRAPGRQNLAWPGGSPHWERGGQADDVVRRLIVARDARGTHGNAGDELTDPSTAGSAVEPAADDAAAAVTEEARERLPERHYEHAELARLLTLAFSPGELDELTLQRGVPAARKSTSAAGAGSETARVLVRGLAADGRLDRFVESLREDHPLVEWPTPLEVPPEPAGGTTGGGPPTGHARLPRPEQEHTDGAEASTANDATPHSSEADGLGSLDGLPDPGAPVESAGSATGSESSQDATPADRSKPLGWLAPTDAEDDEEDAGRRRRLRMFGLAGVAAGALLAAVVAAFIVGRASGGPAEQKSPPPAPAALAGPASGELTRSLLAVTQACALPDESGAPPDVLARAFRSCADRGRSAPLAMPSAAAPPTSSAAPSAAARPPPVRRGELRGTAPPSGSGCLDRCRGQQKQCNASECGPEPTLGSKYADYQRCLARCLRKASQCRMRCG